MSDQLRRLVNVAARYRLAVSFAVEYVNPDTVAISVVAGSSTLQHEPCKIDLLYAPQNEARYLETAVDMIEAHGQHLVEEHGLEVIELLGEIK
ncbi:MAG: hypothetical protein ACOC9V_06115 [Chloroflexota bacterium]